MDRRPGSLEKLLELADKDEAEGLADAPWPPHFRKMEAEGREWRHRARSLRRRRQVPRTAQRHGQDAADHGRQLAG